MSHEIRILGNIGRLEMRFTPSGKPVTNFSVASNRKYTNAAGEKVEETTWFKCASWEKRAEVINQYFKVGDGIQVFGRMKATPEVYTTNSGEARSSYEVTVSNFDFLPGKRASGDSDASPAAEEGDSEIPF